ncbi:MAG: thioredoxin family protein [Crocinitomicaceae bacterium]|nr:thioredoxin family protein [Flavobacteriales bacterium]NQZ35036.1 thioredoxin family protein [Crocinitomicaceae bacterium]
MNKFIALILILFTFGSFANAQTLDAKNVKELLQLVETEKDYSDALDLIQNADNSSELKGNKELKGLVEKLAENDKFSSPDWLTKTTEAVPSNTNPVEDPEPKEGRSLWTIFILALGSGFLALLTPCVFPMIPMTVSFFTKQSKSRAEGIKNSIIYALSIIGIYLLLGLLVVFTGSGALLNKMSTNPWFNLSFFVLLVVFAVSFMGAFEIRLPNKWINKADAKADKGGIIGIFFMALVLALVSFSCTGPILGTLLVSTGTEGSAPLMMGMFGFSLALALPFALFAAFPGWLNAMPQSGGWLNTVKVFLGFLELALAFKFLSNADLAWQAHLLEREVFLAIWIAIFGTLTLYMFGKLRLPHDSAIEKVGVGRAMIGVTTFALVIYMIPGMWGAPLNLINAFPPPSTYAESPQGFGGGGGSVASGAHVDGMHAGPHGLMMFNDYDKALAYAQKVGKPLFVDFTGWNCVNCRKMEQTVWGKPGVVELLREDVVIVSLYIDEAVELPKSEQTTTIVNGKERDVITVGDKWMYMQIEKYKIASQPYYRMIGPNGEDLDNGAADFQNHGNVPAFQKWIKKGLDLYKKAEKK